MNGEQFEPVWWGRGAQVQTIVAAKFAAPRLATSSEELHVPIEGGGAVRIRINRPVLASRGTLLLLHGLGGCSDSPYLKWTGALGLRRGWTVARMDLRGCGGTEAISLSLHNSAQSGDVTRVLSRLSSDRWPRPLVAIGFSLGGALVLAHAGHEAEQSPADAFVAVNPPIDVGACVAALDAPRNLLFRMYFLRRLCRLVRVSRKAFPVAGPEPVPRRIRTLRRFDELFTVPNGGFRSVEEYYRKGSAGPLLGEIRRPTLVLSAKDDPFIPYRIFRERHAEASSGVRFLHPERGGHVGYWQRISPRFWAASVILDHLNPGGELQRV